MVNKSIKRKELLHIVNKLYALFHHFLSENREDLNLAIKIAGVIDRWYTCEGVHGLKRAKAMSNCFVRHLMGTPLESVPLSNQNKRLIHKALLRCVSTPSKVFWVSIFSSFRLYYTEPVVDTSTISSRFKGRLTGLLSYRYLSNLKRVNKSFRFDQNWNATKFRWHISAAAGPNGRLAYTRYLDDLRCLGYSWLTVGLIILFLALPIDNKRETVKALRDTYTRASRVGEASSIHSRLVFLSDKGGKTRVVAIGDILSQSLLHMVHQRCNLVLRRLEQDGTFDQDSARRYIKKMSGDNVPLASIDLTAATDRMPVLFQVYVLISCRILTPLQALGWYWVTTKRSFCYTHNGIRKYIRYKVGQPMGLLSSWPVMAISHHYLVRLSFAAQGFNPGRAQYRVLGDDLTLRGLDVAGEYLKLISYLGMEYSEEKTYISNGVAEFAKSLFCKGEDLSPFPLALLRFNKNTIVSNVLAIMTECKRINLSLTAKSLTELFPKRWSNLVLLAALSPSSPRLALDLQPRADQWIFLQFIYTKRIKYYSRLNTLNNSIYAFMYSDPGVFGDTCLDSPYLQISRDNSESYPVETFRDDKWLLNPEVLLGSNWISYCTKSWPNGLPPLGDSTLIPSLTWEKEKQRDLFLQSSLYQFNKICPGYFTVRCVGKQVGE